MNNKFDSFVQRTSFLFFFFKWPKKKRNRSPERWTKVSETHHHMSKACRTLVCIAFRLIFNIRGMNAVRQLLYFTTQHCRLIRTHIARVAMAHHAIASLLELSHRFCIVWCIACCARCARCPCIWQLNNNKPTTNNQFPFCVYGEFPVRSLSSSSSCKDFVIFSVLSINLVYFGNSVLSKSLSALPRYILVCRRNNSKRTTKKDARTNDADS